MQKPQRKSRNFEYFTGRAASVPFRGRIRRTQSIQNVQMRNRYPTIKDIAAILKISVPTVSRALRDAHDVSQETKEKVLKVAKQINYKPNYNAVGLAKGATHNIGIVLPFITNYYFSTVLTGIQHVANARQYNTVFFVTNDSPETELSVLQNMFISSLDGMLVCLATNSGSHEHLQQIIDNGTPIVFFDRVTNVIKTSRVVQDDYNGAFLAVEHLIKNGYRRIAHLAGPKSLILSEKRMQGYLDALKKHHLEMRPEWILHSGFSQEDGERDALTLLECNPRPDAIFAVNDGKAIGTILCLRDHKIKVGKTIGVVGFTNDPASRIISPSLTTVVEPAFEMGKESCELLIKHIKSKRFIPEERVLSGDLIIRESSVGFHAEAQSRLRRSQSRK